MDFFFIIVTVFNDFFFWLNNATSKPYINDMLSMTKFGIYIAKNCKRIMKVGTKDILKQRKIEKLHTDASWY